MQIKRDPRQNVAYTGTRAGFAYRQRRYDSQIGCTTPSVLGASGAVSDWRAAAPSTHQRRRRARLPSNESWMAAFHVAARGGLFIKRRNRRIVTDPARQAAERRS